MGTHARSFQEEVATVPGASITDDEPYEDLRWQGDSTLSGYSRVTTPKLVSALRKS
jgi:hypothetical protein